MSILALGNLGQLFDLLANCSIQAKGLPPLPLASEVADEPVAEEQPFKKPKAAPANVFSSSGSSKGPAKSAAKRRAADLGVEDDIAAPESPAKKKSKKPKKAAAPAPASGITSNIGHLSDTIPGATGHGRFYGDAEPLTELAHPRAYYPGEGRAPPADVIWWGDDLEDPFDLPEDERERRWRRRHGIYDTAPNCYPPKNGRGQYQWQM